MGKPKLDWTQIANAYITGPDTVTKQSLATLYHTARPTVSLRATAENWDKQRELFRARVTARTQDKKADSLAAQGAEWDATCMAKAKALMDLITDEMNGSPATDRRGNVIVDSKGQPVLFKVAAKDIASAIKTAQDIGKAAMGDTNQESLAITLAAAVQEALK